jgi:N-methylhydantoinase A/oxoprolinase/acetone carboxylase beta subunit
MTGKTYLIGVDTGGTYTDAAVIEADGHRVVASAKSITTKGDLSIGITGAITAGVAELPERLKSEDIGGDCDAGLRAVAEGLVPICAVT